MSAGPFTDSKYESEAGTIHFIRIQPETAAAVINGVTNTAPSDPIDTPGSALASGGKRRFGLIARTVTLKPVGEPPTGYKLDGRLTIPALTQAVYLAATPGTTATYLSKPYLVAGRSPERFR